VRELVGHDGCGILALEAPERALVMVDGEWR
jgi:hypothetical protein